MNKIRLGNSDLDVTKIGYGCMLISGDWNSDQITEQTQKDADNLIDICLDNGINFFDHADIYCKGKSEIVFSEALKKHKGKRQNIYIQSKCGIKLGPPFTSYDFSYQHITTSAENSLKRLGTDYLDVFLLHRPDPLVEPEEVAKAFDALHAAGKVRWFGVSNHTPGQIELLSKYIQHPIVTNQVEMNITHTHLLDAGIMYNQNNPRLARNTDLIEYCRYHNITLQAWSPLARGYLSGRTSDVPASNISAASKLVAQFATQKNVSREAVILAWILRHPAKIQVIPGITNISRLKACCEADSIVLSRDEWYQLFIAGRGEPLP